MSLLIDYSTPGVVRIRCGDEQITVPLGAVVGPDTLRAEKAPAAPPSATPAAAPTTSPATSPADPVEPAPPPATRDELPEVDPLEGLGWPKPFPGVMGIVTIDGRWQPSRALRWPWEQRLGGPLWRPSVLPLALLVTMPDDVRTARLAALRGQLGLTPGEPFVLELAVDPQQGAGAIDVGALQALIDDPASGVDGIRLHFLGEPDAAD